MKCALDSFHSHKEFILDVKAQTTKTGLKEDFNILKLELFQSFVSVIKNVGALSQYTADVSECLLITHCKRPFECMFRNHDFTEQVVHILNRLERMCLFDLYALLWSLLCFASYSFLFLDFVKTGFTPEVTPRKSGVEGGWDLASPYVVHPCLHAQWSRILGLVGRGDKDLSRGVNKPVGVGLSRLSE